MTIPEVFRMYADEIERRGIVDGWNVHLHMDPYDVNTAGEVKSVEIVARWLFSA